MTTQTAVQDPWEKLAARVQRDLDQLFAALDQHPDSITAYAMADALKAVQTWVAELRPDHRTAEAMRQLEARILARVPEAGDERTAAGAELDDLHDLALGLLGPEQRENVLAHLLQPDWCRCMGGHPLGSNPDCANCHAVNRARGT